MELPEFVHRIFRLFAAEGHDVYLVGGTVRDLLRGAELQPDFDFATPTAPEETERILKRGGMRTFAPGRRFGTICATQGEYTAEVTTFRCREDYQPGSRHPRVTLGGSIEEDLARRDFTMNAVALAADGRLIDPYRGQEAIRTQRILVPGEIEATLRDDPLRLLRLARFIAQLGFQPTPKLATASRELAFLITGVSRERWKRELDKLLVGEWVADGLQFLMESELLTFMMPELTPMKGAEQRDRHHHKDVWEHTKQTLSQAVPVVNVRWALLLHDCGKPYTKSVTQGEVHFFHHEIVSGIIANSIMSRLRFSKDQRRTVSKLVVNHMRPNSYDPSWNDSAVRRLRRDMDDTWEDMLLMARADITSRRKNVVQRGISRLEELAQRAATIEATEVRAHMLPKGLGTAIMEAYGLPEGPHVGAILRRLREAVDGGALEAGREIEYYMDALRTDASLLEAEAPRRSSAC